MTESELLDLLAILVLLIAGISLLVSVMWALPRAIRQYGGVRGEGSGRVVFAGYRLVVSALSSIVLLCFVLTALSILFFEPETLPRTLGTRLSLFVAVVCTSVSALADPTAYWRAQRADAAEAAAGDLLKTAEAAAVGLLKRAETTATELREETAAGAADLQEKTDEINERTKNIDEKADKIDRKLEGK